MHTEALPGRKGQRGGGHGAGVPGGARRVEGRDEGDKHAIRVAGRPGGCSTLQQLGRASIRHRGDKNTQFLKTPFLMLNCLCEKYNSNE